MTTHTVSIVDFQFNPKKLNVAKGDSVIWSNDGSVAHSAARDDEPAFDTGLLQPGSRSAPVQFDMVGSVEYFCRPHMGHMKGTIVVS